MTTITTAISSSIPFSRSLVWFRQGWHLMRQAPVKLFFLMLVPLIVEGVFQLLPEPYGMVVSKWAMAFMVAALWPILNTLATEHAFSLRAVFCRGWSKMALLAIVLTLPAATQLWTATLLLGDDGIALLLYGQMVTVTALQLGIIFAAATPLMLLLGFAPARVLLANDTIVNAIQSSIVAVTRAWRPMLVLAILHSVVLLLAPLTLVVSAIITAPWLACVSYQAYADLFNSHKGTE